MHRGGYGESHRASWDFQQELDHVTDRQRLMQAEQHTAGGKVNGNGLAFVAVAQQSYAQMKRIADSASESTTVLNARSRSNLTPSVW